MDNLSTNRITEAGVDVLNIARTSVLVKINDIEPGHIQNHPVYALCRALAAVGFGKVHLCGAGDYFDELDNVTENKVDALVSVCPFCSVMYEDNQRKIESQFNVEYHLPVLYYPQVLGLAFGLDQKQLGFRINKVKAQQLLEKLE